MIADFLITFRETLEAALVVGIVLAYLSRTKQTRYNNVVYIGVAAGIVASVIGALLFIEVFHGFEGRAEQIFEGVTMLLGAFLLTTMILWMAKQKHVAKELQNKVSMEIEEASKFGLFLLVFVAVLREGIETVIFLRAASFVSGNSLFAIIAGVIAAIFLGFLIFVSSMKINLKTFFNFTNILLILFAAGLIVNGVHEFQEAKIIPELIGHVWDINPQAPLASEGIYPLIHEKGAIGELFKDLFGYNASPSLFEAMAYFVYIILVLMLWKNINVKDDSK